MMNVYVVEVLRHLYVCSTNDLDATRKILPHIYHNMLLRFER